MQTSQNTSDLRWYDRPWAALIFFTRLPLWRLHQPPQDAYRSVVEWWPMVGWLTGGLMAAVLYLGSLILPYAVAVLLAVVARLLLTGALHEDGLADFFDGFGGGTSRERILSIMKDSHIGTYGVLSLLLYIGLLFSALYSMTPMVAAWAIMIADPYAKMLAAQVVALLPYARDEQTAKSGVVYRKYNFWAGLRLAVQGLLPFTILYFSISHSLILTFGRACSHSALLKQAWHCSHSIADFSISHFLNFSFSYFLILFIPAFVVYALFLYIRRRIGGYTGDCCGALCLLAELSFYLVASAYV